MPRCNRISQSETFNAVNAISSLHNEHNDCTVCAISIATATPYDQVHHMFKELGRKRGSGSSIHNMKMVCRVLGFTMRRWTFEEYYEVIATYPKLHPTPRTITTHHPRRFPKSWAPYANRTLIFHATRHVLAVVNGKVHDWSVNNSLRVHAVYEITKI